MTGIEETWCENNSHTNPEELGDQKVYVGTAEAWVSLS